MKVVDIKDIKESKAIILANDGLKLYYLEFEEGEELPYHSLNGIGVLQVLEGAINIKFDTGESFDLEKEQLLEFRSSILHTVKAAKKSKILLTNVSFSN